MTDNHSPRPPQTLSIQNLWETMQHHDGGILPRHCPGNCSANMKWQQQKDKECYSNDFVNGHRTDEKKNNANLSKQNMSSHIKRHAEKTKEASIYNIYI